MDWWRCHLQQYRAAPAVRDIAAPMMLELATTLFVSAAAMLALVTLPGTVELVWLTVASWLKPKPPGQMAQGLKLAVVIPAHDEAANIAACVDSVKSAALAADGNAVDIVVVADNCIDDTAEIAKEAGARVLIRNDAVRRGKGYALDFAFNMLSSDNHDALLVVDADSVVAADFLVATAAQFADGADAVQCRYDVLNKSESIRTRLMTVALYAFNVLRPRGREVLGLSAGILGNGFGISRTALAKVPYDASSVVEDLEYHLRLVAAGFRVRFVDTTSVSAWMPTGGTGARTQRARWEGGRIRMLLDRAPGLVGDVVRGRMRQLEPLLDLLLLPLAFHVVLLLPALLTPLPELRGYAVAALAVVAVHVVSAIRIGGGGLADYAALAAAPFYILWKLMLVKALRRNAAADAEWVRTKREPQTGTQP